MTKIQYKLNTIIRTLCPFTINWPLFKRCQIYAFRRFRKQETCISCAPRRILFNRWKVARRLFHRFQKVSKSFLYFFQLKKAGDRCELYWWSFLVTRVARPVSRPGSRQFCIQSPGVPVLGLWRKATGIVSSFFFFASYYAPVPTTIWTPGTDFRAGHACEVRSTEHSTVELLR